MKNDRLEKVRAEVERIVNRRLNLLNGEIFNLVEETKGLTNEIIDFIQEEPKFKIGDVIRFKGNETLEGEEKIHKIVGYDNELYIFDDGTTDLFCEQELYELVEESVNEDFEEAADNALNNVLNTHEIINIKSCLEMFRFGAEWQKEQDHAMLAGMKKMKEKMMEKACNFVTEKLFFKDGLVYTNIKSKIVEDLKQAMKDE